MKMPNHMIRNALIAGLVLVVLSLALVNLMAQTTKTRVTQRTGVNAPVENDRNQRLRTKLAVLLSAVDLTVGSDLPALNVSTYKEVRVQWTAKTNSSELLKQELSTGGALMSVSSSSKPGALPRDRAMELSPDQLLVVALDENETVRWWRLMKDPRLVRAEVGEHTDMHSEKFYLPKVDFTVECPDDPLLREVRFFQPVWNGEEFRLELLGVAPLN